VSNEYQEFQNCPEGKIINELTGKCVKIETDEETSCPEGKELNLVTGRCRKIEEESVTTCKNGYYLNPETGRCKKIQTQTTTECADGYERNPETNRCRKIRTNDASQYPVESVEISESPPESERPQFFVGGIVLAVLGAISVAYVIFQYRKEICKLFRRRKMIK
jgi:hypothetical protein